MLRRHPCGCSRCRGKRASHPINASQRKPIANAAHAPINNLPFRSVVYCRRGPVIYAVLTPHAPCTHVHHRAAYVGPQTVSVWVSIPFSLAILETLPIGKCFEDGKGVVSMYGILSLLVLYVRQCRVVAVMRVSSLCYCCVIVAPA